MSSEVLATAGAVRIVITGEGANFSAVVADANRQLNKLGVGAKDVGKHTVSSMQAASGAIRLFEGDVTRNVRAVERFITTIPGVGKALQIAFPVVGALALGGVIVRVGEQIVDFFKNIDARSRQARESMREATGGLQLANDELLVANDRLRDSIAKIEGKPRNGIKDAIDESVVAADKLGQKLDENLKKMGEALKLSFTSVLQNLGGASPTKDLQKRWEDLTNRMELTTAAGNLKLHDMRSSGAGKDAILSAQGDLEKNLEAIYAEGRTVAAEALKRAMASQQAQASGDRSQRGIEAGDQSHRIQVASGMLSFFNAQSDYLGLENENQQLSEKNKTLTNRRETDAERMKMLEKDLERLKEKAAKSGREFDIEDEQKYWEKLANTIKGGSDLVDEVNKRALNAWEEAGRKKMQALLRDAREGGLLEHPMTPDQESDELNRNFVEGQRQDREGQHHSQEEAAKAFENAVQNLKVFESIQEANIRALSSAGLLTPHQAALQTQQIHGETFDKWLHMAGELSQRFPEMATPGAAGEMRQQGVQGVQDQFAVNMTSASGKTIRALSELTDSFTDLSSNITHVFLQALGQFNDELVKLMTGDKHASFRQVGVSFFSGVSKSMLQNVEGMALRGLGVGAKKGDGYHVYVDNMPGGGAGGVSPKGLLKSGGKGLLGMMNDSNFFSGLFGGRLFGAGGLFGGAFAEGGSIPSGVASLVGERGPELFVPSTPGHIVSNSKLDGMGGVTNHYHIDAKGTDPALVAEHTAHAIRIATQHGAAAGARAVMEKSRRTPR